MTNSDLEAERDWRRNTGALRTPLFKIRPTKVKVSSLVLGNIDCRPEFGHNSNLILEYSDNEKVSGAELNSAVFEDL